MNKKWILIFVFAIMLIPYRILGLSPEYSGSVTPGNSQVSADFIYGTLSPTTFHNSDTIMIKVSLVSYTENAANYNAIKGKYFYLTNNKGVVDSIFKNDIKGKTHTFAEMGTAYANIGKRSDGSSTGAVSEWITKKDIEEINKYFETSKNYTKTDNILSWFGGLSIDDVDDGWTTENWGNETGYRIVLEPCLIGGQSPNAQTNITTYLHTVREWSNMSNSFVNWDQKKNLMYIENDDMVYKSVSTSCNLDAQACLRAKTSDNKSYYGYGMNLVRFPDLPLTKCYNTIITKDPNNFTCNNDGTHASINYIQTMSKRKCKTGEKPGKSENTEYGINRLASKPNKYGKKVGQRCIVACTEKVEVTFPGSLQGAIDVSKGDSYFEWPVLSDKGQVTLYDAKIKGTKTCKIILEQNASNEVTKNCIAKIKTYTKDNIADLVYEDFQNNITLSYTNGSYNFDKLPLNSNTITSTTNYETKPKSINESLLKEGINFTITKTTNLKLPETGVYRYIDKNKGTLHKLSTEIPNGKYNILSTGVLAVAKSSLIKKDNKITKDTYEMQLQGKVGAFQQSIGDRYKCTYKLTESGGNCVCPSGTKNEGKPLNNTCGINSQKFDNKENVCVALKETLCNIDENEWKNHGYDKDSICCPEPYSNKNLTSCINEGKSYEECAKNAGCIGTNKPDPIKCPEGTPNCGLDITDCVTRNQHFGMSLQDAKAACQKDLCGDLGKKGGGIIIYRTIDLNNPFPSKMGNAGNSIVSWSNSINVGRRPGNNWNNKRLVENKILNNRGVQGEAVYTKTPLYTITLDATKIRKIRDYNRTHPYSDFTLRCATKGGGKCISDFLRSPLSGIVLTGGTCKGTNDFDACYNRG